MSDHHFTEDMLLKRNLSVIQDQIEELMNKLNGMSTHTCRVDSGEENTPLTSIGTEMDELKHYVDSVKSEMTSILFDAQNFARKARQEMLEILSNTNSKGTNKKTNVDEDRTFEELKNEKERIRTMVSDFEAFVETCKEEIVQILIKFEERVGEQQ